MEKGLFLPVLCESDGSSFVGTLTSLRFLHDVLHDAALAVNRLPVERRGGD